ncbi:tryptophan-rich sensory protein [Acidaminobacter sp. JC074]|uniref:TspO/MBR family protein n=1 Tax=Acidaminobacter sp. JC074 TaxID=2530199 RepID=UPI001F110C3A|nr:TspO/MBR family protein [Acidaminobacter sp. JC074]MCH4886875.1 tryptophan-rich sensory protein [Acidaminobacter sp. JC074]
MTTKRKAWINGILLLLTLIVNGLGASGFINNMSQKEISDMYQTLITPSPATFSIWSVIYILLILSIVMMIVKKDYNYYRQATEKLSYLFWLSCGLNIIWIISFSYDLIGLSSIFIFAFSIVLVLMIQAVGKLQSQKRLLLPAAFGLYGGWLFIATVVNISAWLIKIEWNGFNVSPEIWSSIVLLVAVALTAVVLLKTENAIFPMPIAWAYYGINNSLSALGSYRLLQTIALIGMVVLIGMSAIQLYKNKYAIMPIVND